MTDKVDGNFTVTAPVTGVFLETLFEPKAIGGGDQKKWSGTFLFEPDHPNLDQMKATMVAVAKAKWPSRDLKELHFCIESGDTANAKREAKNKVPYDFFSGKVVLVARKPEKNPPRLGIVENGQVRELSGDARAAVKSKFYNGCKVFLQIGFSTYPGVGANPDGVNAYLNQVLWVADGERLGGYSMEDTFSGFVGQVSAEDPTAGSTDDEIPF